MNARHRTLHNAVYNTLSWVALFGLNFVFLPFIVGRLGAESYGILVLVLTVIGYFALLDLNLGHAVVKYVAEFNACGELAKLNAVVGATLLLYMLFGGAGTLVLLVIADPMVESVLKIDPALVADARLAFHLGAGGFFFTLMLSAVSAVPNGLNRYDVTGAVSMAMSAATVLGSVLLLVSGFGIHALIVWNILVSIASIAVYVHIARRLLPGLSFRPRPCRWALRTVLRFGLYSFLSRISGVIQFQADRFLTGVVLGAGWVALYFVPFNLISKAMTITAKLGHVIFPVVSDLQGRNDLEAIVRLYLKASRIIFVVANALVIPLVLFGTRFVGLWMGPEFAEPIGHVVPLVALSLYLDALTNVPSLVIDGMGRPKVTGLFALATAGINLALFFPFAALYGLNGVALAFFVSHAVMTPVFVTYANRRLLGLTLRRLAREAYAAPLAAGGLTLLAFGWLPAERVAALPWLMPLMAAASLAYIAVALAVGAFTAEERRAAWDYAGAVLRRVRRARGLRPFWGR